MKLKDVIQIAPEDQMIRVLLTYDIIGDGFAYKFAGWKEDVIKAIESNIDDENLIMDSEVQLIRGSIVKGVLYTVIVGLVK